MAAGGELRRAPARCAAARSKPPKMTRMMCSTRSLYLLQASIHTLQINQKPIFSNAGQPSSVRTLHALQPDLAVRHHEQLTAQPTKPAASPLPTLHHNPASTCNPFHLTTRPPPAAAPSPFPIFPIHPHSAITVGLAEPITPTRAETHLSSIQRPWQICPFSSLTPKQLQQRSHEASVHHAHEQLTRPACITPMSSSRASVHAPSPATDGHDPTVHDAKQQPTWE